MNDSRARPSPPDTPELLGQRIDELVRLIHRRFAERAMAVMAEQGLTMPQVVALLALRHRGGMSIGTLADEVQLSLSATGHLVDRLVAKGLADRREDQADRRRRRVEITPAGTRVVDSMHEGLATEVERAFTAVGPPVQLRLVEQLERALLPLSDDHR